MIALLFDLDGTLLDTAPDFVHVINQLRTEDHLPPLPLEEVRPFVSHGISALLSVGFGYDKDHPQYENKAKRFLHYYRHCLGQHTTQFPGMPELLLSLEAHHIPWGVVTNKTADLAEPLLQLMNLKDRAACLVSGDTTQNPKPHPEPLLYAAAQLGIPAHQCIYIGDAERDILAGKAAHMTTMCALFGYINNVSEAFQWQANHYIHHPNEIWPIVWPIISSV